MREVNMLRGRMDLLLVLDALLQTGCVSSAAKRSCLSQPAVSRALARLRAAFGDPLLVRSAGRTLLTPRAERLREPVQDLLSRMGNLLAPSGFDPAAAKQVFNAVIPDVIAAVLLPRLLTIMADEAPGCRLELAPWPGARAVRPDIVVTSEVTAFPDYRMCPLYRDRDVLVYRAGIGGAPVAADSLSLPHVAVVAAGMQSDPVDQWLASVECSRRVVTVVPHYLLALHLVASGAFVAVLPSRLVTALGPALGVAAIELPMPQGEDEIWLLHPPHHDSDPASDWLRRAVHRAESDAGEWRPPGEGHRPLISRS